MRYTTIGSDPLLARRVSALSLGTMSFGTRTDEATSFAILDRYVAAGGNFIDTSNSYLFFVNGTQGGESEALLGRWRASRGIGDEIVTRAAPKPVCSPRRSSGLATTTPLRWRRLGAAGAASANRPVRA